MAFSKMKYTEEMLKDRKTDDETLEAEKQKIGETNNEHSQALELLMPREMEYSTFREQYKLHQDDTLAQTKELEAKVSKLESELKFLQGEKIEMQVEHETRQAEDATQIAALVSQVDDLEVQLDSSQTENNQMVVRFEKERQELQEYLEQLCADKIELRSKTTGSRGKLDKVYSKLTEVHKRLDDLFQEHKISTESKDGIMANLEQLSEDLKRELEVNGDELSYLKPGVTEEVLTEKEHNYRTAELKDQESKDRIIADTEITEYKLRAIIEQLLTEKEQNYRTAELKYQEDQKVLEDRIARLFNVISANKEVHECSIDVLSIQQHHLGQEALLTRRRLEKLETDASVEQKNQLEKKLEGLKLIVEEENEAILDLLEKKRDAIRLL